MAASGYDFNFIDEDKCQEFICPICTLVARDPHQANCCGQLYCHCCLQQLESNVINSEVTCPTCRAHLTNNYFFDKRTHLRIKFLQVYCNNFKDDGCQWKGDLKDIEDHLQECPYQLVSCSNDCGMDLQRRHLQNHSENDCPKRLVKCEYCNEEIDNLVITSGDHFDVCPEYPTRCTNEGCGKKVPRQQMPSHKESCPKEMISCGYGSVGCDEKMKREEQEEHNEQWREQHLQLAVGKIKRLSKNSYVMKFSGFANKRGDGVSWCSPEFYSSSGGYKMCLNVDANGTSTVEGTHVSCYIWLMLGEYDDILEWPFHGVVTIELLNQLEDRNHHKHVVHFNESTPQDCRSRVIVGKFAPRGWGEKHTFISHSQLDFNPSLNCQYLKDDTLYFRLSVEVTSQNTKPWLVNVP